MFTFRKPKKNRGQQRRQRIDDEDDNSDKEDNGAGADSVAQKVHSALVALLTSSLDIW